MTVTKKVAKKKITSEKAAEKEKNVLCKVDITTPDCNRLESINYLSRAVASLAQALMTSHTIVVRDCHLQSQEGAAAIDIKNGLDRKITETHVVEI